MTDDSDKINSALMLATAKIDLSRIAEEFSAKHLSMLNSPAMRMIEEQSKRFQELTASMSGIHSAASLFQETEVLRASRIAAETASNMLGAANSAAAIANAFPAMDALAGQYADLFRNPYQEELDKITEAARQVLGPSNLSAAMFQAQRDEIRKLTEAIHTPWIRNQNAMASIQGIEGLSSIGKALRESIHPFEKSATHFLRDQLGDWRRAPTPTSILLDPIQRSDFYVDEGLNPLLVDYPPAAFDEAIGAAGIRSKIEVPHASGYQRPVETMPSDDEPAQHMVEAFRSIYAFESRIRRFINELMVEKCGENWVNHRIHGDMKKEWEEKRAKALEAGEPEHPLICYADFTHYETIIVRKDNWNDVFKAVFRNKESVAESLRRLYPMRIPTMHSRIIIAEDMLYLYAETQRLHRAMDTHSKGRKVH